MLVTVYTALSNRPYFIYGMINGRSALDFLFSNRALSAGGVWIMLRTHGVSDAGSRYAMGTHRCSRNPGGLDGGTWCGPVLRVRAKMASNFYAPMHPA